MTTEQIPQGESQYGTNVRVSGGSPCILMGIDPDFGPDYKLQLVKVDAQYTTEEPEQKILDQFRTSSQIFLDQGTHTHSQNSDLIENWDGQVDH